MTTHTNGDRKAGAGWDDSAHSGALLRLLDRPVSAADLARGAEDAARPADARRSGSVGVLLFRLHDETLAVPAKLLRRITPHTRPSPIPHRSVGVLRGICNIRGELVLCADLRRLLGLPARDDDERPAAGTSDPRRMVVIGPADASWVFEVDAVVGVERIDHAGLDAPPLTVEQALGTFVVGLTVIDGRRVSVLDGERILSGFKAGLT